MNHLLIIDPQNDFVSPGGSLYVPNADTDIKKLGKLVAENTLDISRITVTLDCHSAYAIFHPAFWLTESLTPPAFFTTITSDAILAGEFTPVSPALLDYAISYTKALEAGGRYRLCIWPPHCLIATWGHCVDSGLRSVLDRWEAKHPGSLRFVMKGTNPLTEHYSALLAEVTLPDDPATDTNRVLLNDLRAADRIYVAGEALSHCVLFTMRDLVLELDPGKITVLSEYSSPVEGFDRGDCLRHIAQLGIKVGSP